MARTRRRWTKRWRFSCGGAPSPNGWRPMAGAATAGSAAIGCCSNSWTKHKSAMDAAMPPRPREPALMATRNRKARTAAPDQAVAVDAAFAGAPAPSQAIEAPLVTALRRLDAVLGVAVEQQARRLGPASLMDPWLGMHMEQAD